MTVLALPIKTPQENVLIIHKVFLFSTKNVAVHLCLTIGKTTIMVVSCSAFLTPLQLYVFVSTILILTFHSLMQDPHSRSSPLGSPAGAPSPGYPSSRSQTPTTSSNDKLPIIAPWIPRHHGTVNPQMATPPLKRSSPIAPLTEMEIEVSLVNLYSFSSSR